MRMDLKISDLPKVMTAEVLAGEAAVTAAMREAGRDLQSKWRAQVHHAGLGLRLGKTVRVKTYPTVGESLNAASLVWSNAPVIISAHAEGAVIRSKIGGWLAIPTPAAGRGPRGRKMTPKEWEQRRGLRLRFVRRRGAPSLLVADGRLNARGLGVVSRSTTGRGRATVPIFILVPQVTLAKRLNLERDVARVESTLASRIVGAWVEARL